MVNLFKRVDNLTETTSLLNNRKKHVKWSQKLITKLCGVIVFGILLLSAIYLCYIVIYSEIQSELVHSIKIDFPKHISSVATTNGDYLKKCSPPVKCDPNSKYRSVNGSCNNLKTPTWGAAKTPFFRVLDADYSDGYYGIRLQTNGSALPNARSVNTKLFLARETYRVDVNNVLLFPFGQLLAHDVSGQTTDAPKTEDNDIVNCCLDENARRTFPQCQVTLEIPPDDPFYGRFNRSCMTLLRAMTSRNYSCPLNPTTFINVNTHFIDASEVYGSDETTMPRLRTMVDGKLNFSVSGNGQMFCPFVKDMSQLLIPHYNHVMYDTGDRNNGNQNLGITSMQTLFLRFHNSITAKLTSINTHWSDEILYQEARRIVIATIQRIAYEEFLPIIIGDDFQDLYGLNNENIYDPNINPSISQEFSTSAFRILHTIIPVQLNLMNKDYKLEDSITLTDWLTVSDLLPQDDNFDKLLKGFLETPGRIPQQSYNFDISNYMFSNLKKEKYSTGFDLLSIDIIRGRDVGLQPYNQVRHLCGLPLAKDFEDLLGLIDITDIKKLKALYHSVNDIDLMVGLLLERLSEGAIVGPTARCLIADVFYRSKAGDRFFYDVRGQPSSFTPDQLKAIKKITLSHVICTSSNIDHVQKDIFKLVDHKLFPTSKMPCDDEFVLDFKDWKESRNNREL